MIAVLVLVCLWAGPSIMAQDDDISISISLSRDKISLSETTLLSVVVQADGQRDLPTPKLPPLPYFEIFEAGSSTNFEMVNGKVTYAKTLNYLLSPKKVGTFPVRSAHAVVDGKRYESNQLRIEVTEPSKSSESQTEQRATDAGGKSRDLFLTAEVDKKNPFVDEQVTLIIKFFRGIKVNSTPDYTPPQTPGFWSNDIPPQKQYYQTINGRDYLVNEIRTALFPTKPGSLVIEPAQVDVVVPDRSRSRSRDPFSLLDNMLQRGKSVTVRSDLLTVDVKPLPTAGKTADFSGGVGSYKISDSVDKTKVVVNEAVTLTVKISGQGNVKSIPEPILPRLDDFRVEKSASDFNVENLGNEIGGTKTFEYVLIPRLPGTHTIKPLSLNYFDPKARQYKTVSTNEITLKVGQGELTAGAEIPYNPVSGQTLNLKETDIRYIKTKNGHLTKRESVIITSPVFYTVLALPAVVLIGGIFDSRRRRKLAGDRGYARLRRARAEAKKRLKAAQELLTAGDDNAFYAEISAAILQYIADKSNLSAHGMTSDGVDELLKEKQVDEAVRKEIQELVQHADFGRFAGNARGESSPQDIYDRTAKVLADLEGAL